MEGVRDGLKNEMASLQGAVDEAKAMGERSTPLWEAQERQCEGAGCKVLWL